MGDLQGSNQKGMWSEARRRGWRSAQIRDLIKNIKVWIFLTEQVKSISRKDTGEVIMLWGQ